jgi:2-polyprenyl-3-methyl-5-hydroxy-6-metoxy-1,4-benzoquinol methylase
MSAKRQPTETPFARSERERRAERVRRLDAVAERRDDYRARHAYYYEEIERLAGFFIPPGASVLELGCSTGDLLAALRPRRGLGIDISPKTVALATEKHAQNSALEFRVGDAENLDLAEKFDVVVISDTLGHLDDVWAAFRGLRQVMRPDSRLLVTTYNYAWELPMRAAAALGLKMPVPLQNWLGAQDVMNLMTLNDLEVVQQGTSVLCPIAIPGVATVMNRLLARAPLVGELSLVRYFLARPTWHTRAPQKPLSVSVVVPCKNERGNVDDIFDRTPELGAGTELVFVDGNSDDGTVPAIEARLATRPRATLVHQGDGKGKGDAVRKGFAAATGDVLFILDADLTVPPEDLSKFYLAIVEGHGELVNGTRLVYPMEGEAMRFLNLLGNKFFSMAFTYILGRPIKDTLCGTKVLTQASYAKIAAGRAYFGDFDPFGDFDLLFGAARAGLEIVEVPVRYRARTYGDTKISRFRHGFLLLRMTALAFRKFKLTV